MLLIRLYDRHNDSLTRCPPALTLLVSSFLELKSNFLSQVISPGAREFDLMKSNLDLVWTLSIWFSALFELALAAVGTTTTTAATAHYYNIEVIL